jgi:hypothetical protein
LCDICLKNYNKFFLNLGLGAVAAATGVAESLGALPLFFAPGGAMATHRRGNSKWFSSFLQVYVQYYIIGLF